MREMKTYNVLAVDLGASSGRGIVYTFDGNSLREKVVHRFANGAEEQGGHLVWNAPKIYEEICRAVRLADEACGRIDGIGIDTWGVDFGLIGKDGKLLENLRLISSGLSGYATEAPHIYLKDGMYYLIFAEGGTEYGHHEVVGRSSSIYGPYELREKPILSHVDRKGHMIQATGHADFIELSDGRWIAVFLAIRVPGRAHLHNLGRETFMADVTWQDGWPIIGKNGWVELDEPSSIETIPIKDEYISFESDIAASSALRVRAENASNYKRIGDNLLLHGGDTLSKEKGEPTLLLLRQTEFVSAFSATVRTDETLTGKAGVSAFYNSDYHADLFVEKAEDSLRLSFRRKIHDLEVVVCEKIIPLSSSVRFEIRTDSEWYVFFADGNEIGRASIASFSTEGTMYMTFTGTLLGIFAEDGDGIFVDGFGFKGE